MLLRRLRLLWRRLRLRLRFRRRRRSTLLLPLIELLRLLLLLFRTAVLDRRRGPYQRMRLLQRAGSVFIRARLVCILRLRFRIALRLKRPWLRVRLYLYLRIPIRRLAKRTEALLILLRFSWGHLRGLRWSGWTNQSLLIQVSPGLRLPLID